MSKKVDNSYYSKRLKVNKTDNLIFGLLACWFLSDAITGYMLNNGMESLSQVFKGLVAVIVIIRGRLMPSMIKMTMLMAIYMAFYLINVALNGENIGASIILMSKLLTTILIFVYFINIRNLDKNYFIQKVKFVLKWNFIVFAINILLGVCGIGYHSYGGEGAFGSHGFFYSNNELSGVVIAMFPWVFFYLKRKFSTIPYFIGISATLFIAYSMGTKSSLLAVCLSFVLFSFFYGKRNERIVGVIAIALMLYYIFINIQDILYSEIPIMQRFSYFYDKDGFLHAITSGRLEYWTKAGKEFWRADPISILFGLGGGRSVEMDLFDALLNCGLFGFFLLILLYIKLIRTPLAKRNKQLPYSKVIFCINFLWVIVSIVAGHLLFSSMSGMLVAMSNALLFVRERNHGHKILVFQYDSRGLGHLSTANRGSVYTY